MSGAEVESLYREYGERLVAIIASKYGRETAEEATARVWLAVIQGRLRLETRRGIWTYLRTAAMFEAMHYVERDGWPGKRYGAEEPLALDAPGRPGYLAEEAASEAAEPLEDVVILREELLAALGAIPARYRATWEAFLAGLTYDETAEACGLSRRQVDRYLRRGRERMREAVAS